MSVGSKFTDLIRRITKGGPAADEAAEELSVLVDKGDGAPDFQESVLSALEKMERNVNFAIELAKVDADEKMILASMSPDERDEYAKMSDEDKMKKREEMAAAGVKKPEADMKADKPEGEEPEDKPEGDSEEPEDDTESKDDKPPSDAKPAEGDKPAPKDDEENEEVTKVAEEVIQKAVDAATAPLLDRIAKMEDERLTDALHKEWGPLAKAAGMSESELVDVVKSMPHDKRDTFKKGLTATAAVLEKSALFQEIGKNAGVSPGSAEGKLEALAKNYASEKGVGFAIAYDEILKTAEGKRLYAESRPRAN